MNKTRWQQRAAAFDALIDLTDAEREARLVALAATDAAEAGALRKMLADFGVAGEAAAGPPSLAGLAAHAFEAELDAATTAGPPRAAGEDIGAWRLVRKIGEGGMGAVWLATRQDGHFEGQAAIKFLRTGPGNTEVMQRFLRERRLLARLTHPGIARLLDAGTHQGEPYLVMEYVDGEPITAWAAAHAPRVAERVALMLKVCRAAEHAHSQLIVHRDLKPSNVLVTRGGAPSLLDFGIAKLIDGGEGGTDAVTALTSLSGRGYTLGYCAPEQITGEPTGVAADVFAMGVLLFELLTGVLPFRAEAGRTGRAALEHAVVHGDAMSLGRALDEPVPAGHGLRPSDATRARGDLEAIVSKAIRKNPSDRYATVTALADDLERWLGNMPVLARRGNWQYKTLLWLKRNRALAAVTAAAFLAVGAGLVVAVWQAERARNAAALAGAEALRADQEKTGAVEERRRAEIATAQANAALAESEAAKLSALQAQQQADANARTARESAQLASRNEQRSRAAEAAAAQSSRVAQSEAAKAKAVNQYLVTLFESADPERTRGEKLTAREVLDTAIKSLATQFANDPDTLAELQAVLGRTYAGLSLPQTAIPLLTAAAEAMAARPGRQSVEYARVVIALARAEMEAENFPDSEKHYREALPILEAVDGPASETVVMGKIVLAYALQKQGRFAEIDALIAPVRAAVIAQKGEKDWLFAEIENSRAIVSVSQGRVAEEQQILLGIEPLLANPPPGRRSDALTIRNNLAVSFVRTGNMKEAMLRSDAALAGFIAHLGAEAELTMKVMWFGADIRRLAGLYADCAAQFARLAELRARTTGETNPLTVDVFSKAAACAQLAGDDAAASRFAARAMAALPPTDLPPQRTVLRTLITLQFVAMDRADAPATPAMLARARSLATALNLAHATPEAMYMVSIEAIAAARSGDTKSALRSMDAIFAKVPAFGGLPSTRALHTYLLALDGQQSAARTGMIESRRLAKLRYAEGHPIFAVLEYVDAFIERPADRAAAKRALETAAGRTAHLPLAPNWFAL